MPLHTHDVYNTRPTTATRPSKRDWRVDAIVRLIDDNHSDPRQEPSLREAAKAVNLSVSRLRHIFATEIGMSLGRFAKSSRMQRAKELLDNPGLSVKEVMAEVGLNDPSHFTRDFKRAFGLTPTLYRSQLFLQRIFGKDSNPKPAKTANK